MKIKEVIGALERFAPLPLQDGFDNAGLQIGLTEAEATGALLCLDVTESNRFSTDRNQTQVPHKDEHPAKLLQQSPF